MGKLVKILATGVLLLSIVAGIGTNTEASTSQSSYKLTAYNSKGKKVNVNTSKGMVVTKVSGKSWYKGSLKYTSYKKVSGKWKKQSKTSTIYVPSSKVKKYTSTSSTIKPVTTTKWVKKIKTVKGWFTNEENWGEDVKTGDIAKAGSVIMIADKGNSDENGYGYSSLDVEDQYGEVDSAVTLEDAVLTQDPDDLTYGYADVTYIDYDAQKVTTNKKVKITKNTYKTTAATQAYTKIYVPPVKNGITLSEYNKLKKGMIYKQVVDIIGESGKMESSASGYGFTYKSYSWEQKDVEYSWAYIDFENNKLISKAQYGLR